MPNIILAARGRITSRFGEDIGRGFPHRGIDQGHGDGLPTDLEVRAPADGVVTFAGLFGSYGLVLFITHDDGWVSVLAHHDEHLVSKGSRVTQGQLIAAMGNSGTVYVHSHQELRDAQGAQRDPLQHLTTTASATTKPLPELPKDNEMIYLIQRAVDGDPVLNGLECAAGPGFFQALGEGDLAGVARDLHIPEDRIVRGQDGKGLPAVEFLRLMSLFQIPPGHLEPGGKYIK